MVSAARSALHSEPRTGRTTLIPDVRDDRRSAEAGLAGGIFDGELWGEGPAWPTLGEKNFSSDGGSHSSQPTNSR